MYNPFAQAVNNTKQPKPSRLSKTYSINLKKIITILFISIVAFSTIVWATDRLDTHRNWATMVDEAREFRNHMEKAHVSTAGDSSGRDETGYALRSIDKIQKLDTAHSLKLSKIENLLMDLRGLNETQTSELYNDDRNSWNTIHGNMRLIGNKILSAYSGFINYTYINTVEGPPFWYIGPSPPDEATLQEAVNLAVASSALIEPYL